MSQMTAPNPARRAIVVVVDGCGIGAAPDAAAFGDAPVCNTIGNVARAVGGLKLPTMGALGLGNVSALEGVNRTDKATGFFGKLEELSRGKDTQTGHWEMMGIVGEAAFPLYPEGFPSEIVDRFVQETGCKGILCNKPYSGTQVLEDYGPEHQKTGKPIVYTSGDSVFQIACDVETVPLHELYRWCEIARAIMQGPHRIGRIIARPFKGTPGNYKRLSFERRDYGVKPPSPTFLDVLMNTGAGVLGIGKIEDIFDKEGLTHAHHTGTNLEGLNLTVDAVQGKFDLKGHSIVQNAPDAVQMIFTNLVDTDSLYGHRRNVEGYAKALVEIDEGLGRIIENMRNEDLLIVSSDHGNDPTAPGTDHTREYVPLIAYSKLFHGKDVPRAVGTRHGFVDIAASLANWFEMPWTGPGVSFIPQESKVK